MGAAVALKFQYNTVSMQTIQKELKIRMSALPTLKSKEASLRVTIKKERRDLETRKRELEALRESIGDSQRLFAEFSPEQISIAGVEYGSDNIAGIAIPTLGEIRFHIPASGPLDPAWFTWGRRMVMELLRAQAEIGVAEERLSMLECARKKTTQKVNLYEKVQVPEFSRAILKIKRYLEDVENLEKAAQKIIKARHSATEAA